MSAKQFMGVVALAALFVVFSTMFIQMIGTAESGVDMTSSAYETQYNSTSELNQLAVAFMKFIPVVLAVLGLMVVLMWLMKTAKKGFY